MDIKNLCLPKLVLPTVYNDELSYYECINKIIEYLNELYNLIIHPSIQSIVIDVTNPGYNLKPLHNDGVTDNATSLQTIIDYYSNNGVKCVLVFPKGSYVINKQINIPSNFILFGLCSEIKMNAQNQVCFWLNGENIKICGFSFNTNANCIYISLSKNVEILNCYFTTMATTPGYYQYGITISHSSFVEISNCCIITPLGDGSVTYVNNDGIHINGGTNNVLIKNIYGYTGDDFIAINAAEPSTNPGSISNIKVINVNMTLNNNKSNRGVRIYGVGENQTISNIVFEDCVLCNNTNYAPVCFTNNPNLNGSGSSDMLYANNITFTRCSFISNTNMINFAYSTVDYIDIIDPVVNNNAYMIALNNSNVATVDINKITNCGIASVSEGSSLSRLSVKRGILNNCYILNVNGFVDVIRFSNLEINGGFLTTSSSTGNINVFTIEKSVIKGVTNNLILYTECTILTMNDILVEDGLYLMSFPKTCNLLMTNNISFTSTKPTINSIINATGLQRCKGMLTIQKDLSGIEGDYYLYNNSGNIEFRIFANGSWKTVQMN